MTLKILMQFIIKKFVQRKYYTHNLILNKYQKQYFSIKIPYQTTFVQCRFISIKIK